jgi:hypothetical protein
MLNFINSYATLLDDRSGIDAVMLEMKRQREDAIRTKRRNMKRSEALPML